MEKTLYLVLENGKIFKGYSIGAEGDTTGEVVFQTSVIGYNETLTDPKYYGQIVVDTFPLVGNYGIIKSTLQLILKKWQTSFTQTKPSSEISLLS